MGAVFARSGSSTVSKEWETETPEAQVTFNSMERICLFGNKAKISEYNPSPDPQNTLFFLM